MVLARVCVKIIFCQETKHKRRQSFSLGFGSGQCSSRGEADTDQRQLRLSWLQFLPRISSEERKQKRKVSSLPSLRSSFIRFPRVSCIPPTLSHSLIRLRSPESVMALTVLPFLL